MNILLVRTDRVGDLIMSTPAIASFRRSWPHAHITAVVTDYTEPVLRFNPDIDTLVSLPHGASSRETLKRVRALGRMDLAVALAPRTPDLVLAGLSRARSRLGYVYRRRYLSRALAHMVLTDFCLSTADPGLADRYPDEPVLHEVHQVLALVSLAGGNELSEELVLRVPQEDRAFAAASVPRGAVVVPLAPRWLDANFGVEALRSLLSRLAGEYPDVLVTYGRETASEAEALRDGLNRSNIRWIGELPLLRWAAVIAQGSVVISVDTGATHIAAAMKIPVVVIFEREFYQLCSHEWSPWRVPSVLLCKPPAGADPGPLLEDVLAGAQTMRSHG
ncbi:MAG: glycosyltransferase family 9 protein, partial [Candidatus Eremiobacteraeota bacterium]|nr:glycosyltransferase family 9 protein [Candidatus Eremiobacteraeota bacterium]